MFRKIILAKLIRTPDEVWQNFKQFSLLTQNFRFPLQRSRPLSRNKEKSIQIIGDTNKTFLRNIIFVNQFVQHGLKTTSNAASWRSQTSYDDRRRKVIPKLIYLHNPWKYLVTKYNMWKLQLLWDREFVEKDFIRGSKQAAVVLTDIIRNQSADKVSKYTTPLGFQQITRDMLLSRNDARLKLVKFETEHLRRAIPMKVATRSNFGKHTGRKYCFIDMLFVGLRNTRDFDTPEEVVEIKEVLRQLDADMKTPQDAINTPHRIVFAEILIRFRRNYSDYVHNNNNANAIAQNILNGNEIESRDWAVSFYKILTFDVLNYDPRT